MSPRIVNKITKRKKIFNTAIKLFAKYGYENTTVSQIAKAAKIGKGTFYEYFDSKEDIIRLAFEKYVTPEKNTLQFIENPNISPFEKIKILPQILLKEMYKELECGKVILNLWLSGKAKKIDPNIDFKKMYKKNRELADLLLESAKKKREIRNDIPSYTSSILIGMLEGIILQILSDPQFGNLDKIGEAIEEILIKGLKP